MNKPLIAALSVVLVVGACGSVRDSRLNPFNWFGASDETAQSGLAVPSAAQDHRPLVDQVVSMTIESVPGGAIVRATGLPPTQGHWDAKLIKDETASTPDALVFRFVIMPPPAAARVSTPQSREVTVATYLSDIRLEAVRKITVTGASNARSSRR